MLITAKFKEKAVKFVEETKEKILRFFKKYHTSPQRRVHIIEGDTTGGRHAGRYGDKKVPPNQPSRIGRKTYFPRMWSDADMISAAEEAARKTDGARVLQPNGRFLHPPIAIMRKGVTVNVQVITTADGLVWTAWPIVP